MEYEDYVLMLDGYRTKMNIETANIRKQTYILIDVIAKSNGVKKGISLSDFNRAWPLPGEVQQDVKEALKERIKVGREMRDRISNEVNLRELYKKLKQGGNRGSQNTNKRGRRAGDK